MDVGTGMAFDYLQAFPISKEIENSVKKFETLTNIINGVDYNPKISDATNKALSKYYFRHDKLDKALLWVEKTKDKSDSEFNFIKGLILWKKGDPIESRKYLSKSNHPKANYYNYLTYASVDDNLTGNSFTVSRMIL